MIAQQVESSQQTSDTPRSALGGRVAAEDFPVPSERLLRRAFHLTRAEALLAQGMAVGESLEEAAVRLGIRITTARTQLAAIFAKTATRRQARLVALLSHLAHLEPRQGTQAP